MRVLYNSTVQYSSLFIYFNEFAIMLQILFISNGLQVHRIFLLITLVGSLAFCIRFELKIRRCLFIFTLSMKRHHRLIQVTAEKKQKGSTRTSRL